MDIEIQIAKLEMAYVDAKGAHLSGECASEALERGNGGAFRAAEWESKRRCYGWSQDEETGFGRYDGAEEGLNRGDGVH